MHHRLQFSLRALLVAITVACLWLGWKVERARTRGSAIDAILAVGGKVFYDLGEAGSGIGGPPIEIQADHFWPDARSFPIEIVLPEELDVDGALARYLEQAGPVQTVAICHPIHDDALWALRRLNDGCAILLNPQHLSAEAIAELRRTRPQLTISEF
jgi:hypothetical protein